MPMGALADRENEDLEWCVRFLRPEKPPPVRDLPGGELSVRTIAQLFGVPDAVYHELVSRFQEAVETAATQILEDQAARASARGLARLSRGIMALGDSNTDDRQSWAEILDRVLAG